jgi:hypothetical protein
MNLMCSLVRPGGAVFIYSLPQAADQWSISVAVGVAHLEIVASEPLALRLAVVDEMGRAKQQALSLEHRPYGEKEARGALASTHHELRNSGPCAGNDDRNGRQRRWLVDHAFAQSPGRIAGVRLRPPERARNSRCSPGCRLRYAATGIGCRTGHAVSQVWLHLEDAPCRR